MGNRLEGPAVTPADEDGDGVLGNLPRSRPGRRSERRAATRARQAQAGRRPTAARETASGRRASPTTPAEPGDGGPLDEAARLAGRAARLGLGIAGGVLKRLPRP